MVVLMFSDENGSYFWYNSSPATYREAIDTCNSQDGVLAVVDNFDLSELLRQPV